MDDKTYAKMIDIENISVAVVDKDKSSVLTLQGTKILCTTYFLTYLFVLLVVVRQHLIGSQLPGRSMMYF